MCVTPKKCYTQASGALNVLRSVLWRGWVAPLVGILYGWRKWCGPEAGVAGVVCATGLERGGV